MSEPFQAEIIMFAGNFAPRGWAYCSGQLLPIAQNTALFSLLGTTYGGDGRTSFALPDLRGRVPRGSEGNMAGPGLTVVRLGEKGGAVNHTLQVSELAAHHHVFNPPGIDATVDQINPIGHYPAQGAFYVESGTVGNMAGANTQNTGNGNAFSILNPYLGLNYIIATVGTFPSRS